MGLFTQKTKVKDPFQRQKTTAVNWLVNQLNAGTPEIPTQQIAGLTDLQKLIQGNLTGQYNQANQNYDTARGYYQDVLNNDYDPRTGDFYRGYRQEMDELKGRSNSDIRRSAQKGGMLGSMGALRSEADNTRNYDAQILQMLGGLYETERNRKENAASSLQGLDAQRLNTTGQVSNLAEQERIIQQQKNDALYQQALMTILFPYQQQIQIANSIMGASQPIVTGGGMTDLGFLLNAGASAAGSYYGMKARQ